MKNGLKLHEWQKSQTSSKSNTTAKDDTSGWVVPQPCHICKKVIAGAYGHTTLAEGVVWSCSSKCEKEMQHLRKEFYSGVLDVQQAVPPSVGT